MMPRNRIASPARLRVRPLHHIHLRPVVLQEIEIDGGELAPADAPDCAPPTPPSGTPPAAPPPSRDSGTRRPRSTPAPASRTAGNRDASPRRSPRRPPRGCVCGVSVPTATCTVTGIAARVSLATAGCFARTRAARNSLQPRAPALRPMPMPSRVAFGDRLIHLAARLFGRAEAPVRQHRLHVFAGLARNARSRNRESTPRRSSRTPSQTRARIRSSSTGASPHLITCPPMPHRIARFFAARACQIASTTARNESAASNRAAGNRASPPMPDALPDTACAKCPRAHLAARVLRSTPSSAPTRSSRLLAITCSCSASLPSMRLPARGLYGCVLVPGHLFRRACRHHAARRPRRLPVPDR